MHAPVKPKRWRTRQTGITPYKKTNWQEKKTPIALQCRIVHVLYTDGRELPK